MRLVVFTISIIALISSVCAGTCAPEKTQAPDVLLSRPVTIECVNVRLHSALDQLAESTGVAIRCGRDNRDWQVRDIPVTVCAKDIPLGKLLKSIAASTHLLLSKEQAGQITIYRIWRDKKRVDEMNDYFKAKAAADADSTAWDWDAVCKAKDAPASAFTDVKPNDKYKDMAVALGRVLSSLGPEVRNQVLSGSYFKCTDANTISSMGGDLNKILQDIIESMPDAFSSLTLADLQKTGFAVYLRQDNHGQYGIDVSIGTTDGTNYGNGDQSYGIPSNFARSYASKQGLAALPSRPAPPALPAFETPDGDWKKLDDSDAWNLPALQTKISLDAPKDKDSITCGSLLAALSKAGKFSIVCEDFESHRLQMQPEKLFIKDTTIKAVLQGLDYHAGGWPEVGFVWYINEKDKIVLGTADRWPYHHNNLVAESFLTYLKQKLNGDGVDLDDYLKFVALDKAQADEWFRFSPDVEILEAYKPPLHKEFWLLYDSLSRQQKAQVQTEAGLPMRDLQPAYVAYLISCYNQGEADKVYRRPWQDAQPKEFPYDEQSVASLVMKVTKRSEKLGRWKAWSRKPYPEGTFTVDAYNMTIEVTQNGEKRSLDLAGPEGLPFRSPEREKALGIKPKEQ